MIPGTTVWLFWLFRILCPLAPTPWSFSPSLYICHLFCICVGCSLAGELSSCPCLQRFLSQMPLQRRQLSLLCVSAAIISATLCCQLLSFLLLNLSTASVCPSNKKIRQKMPAERSFTLVLMLLWREGAVPAGRCLSASLPNQLKELNYLIAQPEIWTIYSKSSCRWRHIYTNCAITCFIPITTAILLGHSPDLDRDDCREISALLTNTRSSRASIMPQQQAAPMVIQLPAVTSVVSVIKN